MELTLLNDLILQRLSQDPLSGVDKAAKQLLENSALRVKAEQVIASKSAVKFSKKEESIANSILILNLNGKRVPYLVGNKIASGGHGVLKHAYNLETGEHIAIKIVRSEKQSYRKNFELEAKGLQFFNRYYGELTRIAHNGHEKYYLAEELINGETLKDFISDIKYEIIKLNADPIPLFEETIDVAIEVLQVIAAMQKKSGIHRDIKPRNIMLVSATGKAVVIDLDSFTVGEDKSFHHFYYTEDYDAPELRHSSNCTLQSDAFSVGTTLDVLFDIFLNPPYSTAMQATHGQTYQSVNNTVSHLLRAKPERRISIQDALIEFKNARKAFGKPAEKKYFEAIRQGRDVPCRLAIDGGEVAITDIDKDGFSAAELAVKHGQVDIFEHLLRSKLVDTKSHAVKQNLMMLAIQSGGAAMLKYLVEQGFYTEGLIIDDEYQKTPLHLAIEFENEEAVIFLLTCPQTDVNAKTKELVTPLTAAAEFEETGMLTHLLKVPGIKLDEHDDTGFTALHWAVENEDEQSVQLLVEHGADIESLDAQGRRPLDLAPKSTQSNISNIIHQSTLARQQLTY